MFSTKTSEADALRKVRKFHPIFQSGMFRKRTENGVSTENVLTGGLNKNSVFYAVMSAKAS